MAENTFTVEIPLRWGDMDAYGHVNNVTLMQILEEARVAVFGPPPASGDPLPAGGTDVPAPPLPVFSHITGNVQALISEHTVKYRKPLPYRGLPARVEVAINKVSAAAFTISYRVYDAPTGDLCTTATTTLAFFDADAGRLVRLPVDIRAQLAQHLTS